MRGGDVRESTVTKRPLTNPILTSRVMGSTMPVRWHTVSMTPKVCRIISLFVASSWTRAAQYTS